MTEEAKAAAQQAAVNILAECESDVPDSPPDWSFDSVNEWVHSEPDYTALQNAVLSLAAMRKDET